MTASMVEKSTSLRNILIALIAVALAAIPPLLVVLDRWFGNRMLIESLRQTWCSVDALCRLAWPPYFLLILPCTAAVLIVVAVSRFGDSAPALELPLPRSARSVASGTQRRAAVILIVVSLVGMIAILSLHFWLGSLPGWDLLACFTLFVVGWSLHAFPLARVAHVLRRRAPLVGVYLLVHLALLAFLASYFGMQRIGLWSIPLAASSAIWILVFRRQIHPVFWVFSQYRKTHFLT
jgi:hypothetical protein